ncbi:hypothetical protein IJI28_01105 [Candidatus Saccharibacteria bacterium]|nr:hypothetical protein [Candidatus Saccharibacteria bacterium]
MKKKQTVILLICFLIVGFAPLAFIDGNVSAASETELLRKVLLRGLEKCYDNKYIPGDKEIDGTTSEVKLDAIFSEDGSRVKEDTIKVFSKDFGNTLTQDVPAVSCQQLFEGYSGFGGSIKGLEGLTNKKFDISQVGFHTIETTTDTSECIKIPFTYVLNSYTYKGYSNELCFPVDGNGNTLYDDVNGTVVEQGESPSVSDGGSIKSSLGQSGDGVFYLTNSNDSTSVSNTLTCSDVDYFNGPVKFTDLANCFAANFDEVKIPTNIVNNNANNDNVVVEYGKIETKEKGVTSGIGNKWMKDTDGAAIKALKYYGGLDSFDDITFTEQEKYDVLHYYVKKAMSENSNMAIDPDHCYDTIGELGDNSYGFLNKGKWCKITGWENVGGQYNVIKNEIKDDKQALKTVEFEEVLKRIKKIDTSKIDTSSGSNISPNGEEEAEASCRNVSGAKGLGWILCPILEWMGGAATGLYDGVVEPLLSIDPKLFNNNETNNTTEEAWGTFRNIANVIFIILLLVVIFSQLTGVGIDNYGIKKILPRLIVAAIMINLSYLICILLVDISNILGSGLRGIFEVLGGDINPTISMDDVVFADGSTATEVSGAIAGVSLLGLLAGGIGSVIFGGAATLLSLFIGAIGVVISILFMFLLLSVREAAIVVLVILSPLAVVAYMLPNTKKLFDKWWKFFEGLLLVYPIAGLLIGAGNYVSKLLLAMNPNDFFSWITAMVVGIVPIFFIPTVLKGAFSAMGKMGGLLTGLGGAVSKKATTAANNTGIAKNIRKGSEDRQLRWKAGMDKNGNTSALRRRVGTILSVGNTNRQRNALAYQRAISERGSLNAADSENFMLDTLAGNEVKRIKASDEASNIGALQKHLQDALKSGDRAKIMAYTDVLTGQGQYGRDAVKKAYNESAGEMSDVAAKTFARNIMLNHASDYKSNSRSLFEVARGINNGETEVFGSSANGGFKKTSDYVAMTEDGRGRKHLMMKSDAGTMADMDNSSFAETFLGGDSGAYKAGDVKKVNLDGLNDPQKEAIGKNAFNALRNASNMDANRVAFLREILSQSGYQEGPAGPGGSTGGTGGSGTSSGTGGSTGTAGTGDSTSGGAGRSGASGGTNGGAGTGGSSSAPTPVSTPTPASGPTVIPEGYAEYDNISGRSSMILREMPDGTLQDSSGNTYSAARWKRAGRVESGADSSRPQPQRQTQPQPRPQSQPIRIQNTGAGGMPQTRSGIVLPGDTSQISKLAEQARKSNNNNNGQ